MNIYPLIFITIFIIYIYYNPKQSIIVTDPKKYIYYNIYKNYIPKNVLQNSLPSSAILQWSFEEFNAHTNIYNYTVDIQKNIGRSNVVFGIKKENDKYRWEYYFYGLNLYEKTDKKKLYSYNKKLQIENYMKIHTKYFTDKLDFNKFHNLNKKLIIYSVDVTNDNFKQKKVDTLDVYYDISDDNKYVTTPYLCEAFGYKINNNFLTKKANLFIYNVKQNRNLIEKHLSKLNFNQKYLLKNWYKCRDICIIDKKYSSCICIYYFKLDFNSFIKILNQYQFKKSFIQKLIYNRKRIEHLSFEIGVDYEYKTYKIKKVSIYGTL